jgi:Fe-S-cluster containining protein
MTHGSRLLRFHCTACGQCCRHFRVPVTGADVRRLRRGRQSEAPVDEWVEWLSPADVDMTGEPETFVELSAGRRLLVLRQVNDACTFLQGAACSVYESRPRSCRLYPWDVRLGRRGGVRRLQLLHAYPACEATYDGGTRPQYLAEQKRLERTELEEYVRRVSDFNRTQRRRKRLGKPLLSGSDFLTYLLNPARATNAGTARASEPNG